LKRATRKGPQAQESNWKSTHLGQQSYKRFATWAYRNYGKFHGASSKPGKSLKTEGVFPLTLHKIHGETKRRAIPRAGKTTVLFLRTEEKKLPSEEREMEHHTHKKRRESLQSASIPNLHY